MIKRIFKINIIGLIIFFVLAIPFYSVLASYKEFQDIDNLYYDFKSDPLFTKKGFLPGQEIESWIKIKNETNKEQKIFIKAIDIKDTDELSSQLNFSIKREDVVVFKNNLKNFFEKSEVFSKTIKVGEKNQYDLIVGFQENSDNTYQAKNLTFDILIGVQEESNSQNIGGVISGIGESETETKEEATDKEKEETPDNQENGQQASDFRQEKSSQEESAFTEDLNPTESTEPSIEEETGTSEEATLETTEEDKQVSTEEEIGKEQEKEQKEKQEEANFLANLRSLLGDFGTKCFNCFPWWALFILALYPLYRCCFSAKKKEHGPITWFIWTVLHLIVTAILYFSGYFCIPLWVFVVFTLGTLLLWKHYYSNQKRAQNITLVALILVLLLLILLLILKCLYLWLILFILLAFFSYIIATGRGGNTKERQASFPLN